MDTVRNDRTPVQNMIESVQVYKIGDAIEFLESGEIPDKSVDLIILDPPFGSNMNSGDGIAPFASKTNWARWIRTVIELLYPTLKDTGSIYACSNFQTYHFLAVELERAGFRYKCDYSVVYKGSRKRPMFNRFHTVNETWFYGVKSDKAIWNQSERPLSGNKTHLSYWLDDDGVVRHLEKSVKLLSYFIKLSTHEGMVVLDPFLGRGSTLEACNHTNRNGTGFEIDHSLDCCISNRTMAHTPPLTAYL